MHHVKGEEVDSLDGGDVFAGYVGKVIPGVLNRDLVCDDGVFHRLQRRRPHGCMRMSESNVYWARFSNGWFSLSSGIYRGS